MTVEKTERVFGVNELVGVAFERGVAVVFVQTRAAIFTAFAFPLVNHALENDVAFGRVEGGANRVFAVRFLRAIHAPPRQQGGDFGDGYAENLLGEDVIDAFLTVGDDVFQSRHQAFGNLAQEDARLGGGVEEGHGGVAPNFLREQIQHLVGDVGRREDFVAGQVGEARKHVGVVVDEHGFSRRQNSCLKNGEIQL